MSELPDAPWLVRDTAAALPDAPWLQHGAEAPPEGYGLSGQVVKGIPVVGGLAQKGAAAVDAALDPAVAAVRRWRGAPELPSTQGTFGERYGHHLDELRAQDTGFEERHPIAAPALQVAGGAMAFGNGPRPVLSPTTIHPPLGPPVMGNPRLTGVGYQPPVGASLAGGTAGGLARRMTTAGASNAALGGADAATKDQDAGEGAALGGALGAAGPLAGRVVGGAINRFRGTTRASAAPIEQALRAAGDADFTAARNTHLAIPAGDIMHLSSTIEQDLLNRFNPMQAPETFDILRRMQGATGIAEPNGLLAIREQLANAARNHANPREGLAAGHAIEQLDNFLSSQPSQFSDLYARGRGNWGAAKRSERFSQDVLENASRNADVAHAGENLGNNTRQRLNAVIKSNQRGSELGRGLNEDEVAAMDRVARGTGFANGARRVQSWTGGLKRGSVASIIGGLIGASHGPMGAVVGAAVPHAISDLARRAAEASTVRGARGIDEMLRLRSPLGARANAARAQAAATNDAAMRRGALASRVAQTPIAQMLQEQFQ